MHRTDRGLLLPPPPGRPLLCPGQASQPHWLGKSWKTSLYQLVNSSHPEQTPPIPQFLCLGVFPQGSRDQGPKTMVWPPGQGHPNCSISWASVLVPSELGQQPTRTPTRQPSRCWTWHSLLCFSAMSLSYFDFCRLMMATKGKDLNE